MRFHQFNRVGRDLRQAVRVEDRLLLALGARRVNRVPLAVARRTDALEHGVDRVAIALGIGEALQDHDAETFAEDGAITIGIEWLRISGRR